MRILTPLAALGLAALVVPPAGAQAQTRARNVAPQARAMPGPQRRGPEPYGTPPGSSGTIKWNTPNASGNLGGPGAGGSSAT